jgi:hypothetical protein
MGASNVLIGEKCEFKAYRNTKKKDGKVSVEGVPQPFDQLAIGGDKDSSYTLVINRFLGEKNQLEKTTLQVNSPHLLKVFREVVKSYPTVASDFTSPFELESPFQMLLHYWDELDHRRLSQDADERMHLNLLFDFMTHEIGPARERLLGLIRKNQITYLNAWCLFRPGDLLYMEFMDHPWLLRCQKTAYEESTSTGPFLEIHCTYTDHDGTLVGGAHCVINIYQKRSFGAENPAVITELPIYPRKFVKGKEDLEDRLKKRGRGFLALSDVAVKAYDGQAQYLKEPGDSVYDPNMANWGGVWLPYTELGRVILDRKTFQEEQYSNAVRIRVREPDPLLCPPYEFGFSLSRKEWCRFFIDYLRDVKWKENPWQSLIIGDQERLVLKSLVTSHTYPNNPRDQTQQKGKGLVILLHGTPGSGKTLTAETAAEGTEKALISTSLGELNKWNRYEQPWTSLDELDPKY